MRLGKAHIYIMYICIINTNMACRLFGSMSYCCANADLLSTGPCWKYSMSVWSSDTIWHRRSGSTSIWVKRSEKGLLPCSPSPELTWLISNKTRWHLAVGNFRESDLDITRCKVEITYLRILLNFQGGVSIKLKGLWTSCYFLENVPVTSLFQNKENIYHLHIDNSNAIWLNKIYIGTSYIDILDICPLKHSIVIRTNGDIYWILHEFELIAVPALL